ncbi:MAG TPA: hypothetical protein VK001_11050, partial [Geminicoccaceae bacterium]|nr:hypothetical protein [Geminicoccaceae bacterium]
MAFATGACAMDAGETGELDIESESAELGGGWFIPNNFPILNENGLAATYSTEGYLDLGSEFFQEQGTNGRDCTSCHRPDEGWSITPQRVQLLFLLTGGTHPIFDTRDGNSPDHDYSTVQARWNSYSMLLQGLFRRSRPIPAGADFELVAVDDPHGFANADAIVTYRRPLASTNLFLYHTLMWDDRNTVGDDLRAGLRKQANGNVTGAQEGPEADPAVIEDIVDFEIALSTAQTVLFGVGRLDVAGARGGPEHLANQAFEVGPFDIYDAWANTGSP